MRNRASALYRQAARVPTKAAVIFEDRTWTFAQLLTQAQAYAAGLAQAGFGRGDKLGIMMATRPEFIAVEYAVFILGGVVLPMNVHYLGHEIEHALGSCDVEYLAVDAEYAARFTAGFAERCPALRRVFVFGSGAPLAPPLAAPLVVDARPLRADPEQAPAPADLADDDVVLMLYTSATTGKAKGVMLTVANLEANQDPSPAWLQLAEDEVILCALPLYNTFALNQCINATVLLGATLVLLPRFEALECLKVVQRYRCTSFPAVPTMLQRLLHHPEVDRFDLTSLRRFCVGAAPVPAPLLALLRQRINRDAVVIHGYGLTESTALVSVIEVTMDESGRIPHAKSIGRALPGIEMRIVDDAGRPAPLDTVGEICIRGPNVMKGYYKAPEATAQALVDGWLHTGDLGTMDAEGYFAIVDRKKDLIIRGGQNIYPADIEEALYRHAAVQEAAIVALPDEELGEVPKGFVALKPGARATPEELLTHCRAELAYFKVPVAIEIRPELPKGPTGKILRRALRADDRRSDFPFPPTAKET